MNSLREWVRTSVPFSTEAYERITHRKRRKASRAQVPDLLARSPLKLDLGGGYRSGSNGWINVDTSPQADFYWHLGEPLPLPDDSVDALYSSHLLEHLTFAQTQHLLAECARVLKPGHEISVCVPNARLFIEHYMGTRDLPQDFFAWKGAYNNTTRIDAVNYIAYLAGEHTYMFDQENLEFVLRSAGFADVRARTFDPALDLLARDAESIYAVGVKPHRL